MKKKQEEQADAEDRKDEILTRILQKEAVERLNNVERLNPQKVRRDVNTTPAAAHLSASASPLLAFQVDKVKDQLLAKRSYWLLNGPVTDEQVKKMLEEADQVR